MSAPIHQYGHLAELNRFPKLAACSIQNFGSKWIAYRPAVFGLKVREAAVLANLAAAGELYPLALVRHPNLSKTKGGFLSIASFQERVGGWLGRFLSSAADNDGSGRV
jgi:hypothetical protein